LPKSKDEERDDEKVDYWSSHTGEESSSRDATEKFMKIMQRRSSCLVELLRTYRISEISRFCWLLFAGCTVSIKPACKDLLGTGHFLMNPG
jgi:hypothetical protein